MNNEGEKTVFAYREVARWAAMTATGWALLVVLLARFIFDTTWADAGTAAAWCALAAVVLMHISFGFNWLVENTKNFVNVVASLIAGGLVWAHVWLLLHVTGLLSLFYFDLYSVPSFVGLVATSVWIFEAATARPKYKHVRGLWQRFLGKQ